MRSSPLPLRRYGHSPLKPSSHFSTQASPAVSSKRLKNGTSPRVGCLHPIPNTAVSQSGSKTRTPRWKARRQACVQLAAQAHDTLSEVKPPSVHVPEPEVPRLPPEDGSNLVFTIGR